MEMKIYDRNLTGAAAAGSTRTQDTQKADSNPSTGVPSSSRSGGGDQVELSGTLGRLSQALAAQGTERASHVATLTAAYRSGSYQPDSMGASKGLISEALSASGDQ